MWKTAREATMVPKDFTKPNLSRFRLMILPTWSSVATWRYVNVDYASDAKYSSFSLKKW